MLSTLIVTQEGTVVGSSLDVTVIATLASLLVPLLVSLITKQAASDGLKSVVNIVATAAVAVLALWINPGGETVTWQIAVNTLLASFVASLTAYKGLWKPTGLTGSVNAKTSAFGIGPKPVMQTEEVGE